MDQAKEQINRNSYELPTIELSNVDILNGEFDYEINNYEYHPTIKAPLSN
jgi:thymidylate synthase